MKTLEEKTLERKEKVKIYMKNYMKGYMKEYRKREPEKVKEITLNYYRRKLERESANESVG